jgi:hypothetical protein
VLAWSFPIGKFLILDQAITDELAQLVLHRGRSRLDLLHGPHGHELLVLDY